MTDRFAALRSLPRIRGPSLHDLVKKPTETTVPEEAPKPLAAAPPTPKKTPKCKPNDPCSCGSHKKYKKCCMTTELAKIGNSPIAQVQEMMRKDKDMAAKVRQMAEVFLTANKDEKSAKK